MEGELQLELEHSFDSGVSWSGRGSITVTSTRTGAASQDQPSLSQEQKTSLAELCEAGGLYLIRARAHQGANTLPTMSSFTSACSLIRSGMVDAITLNMDWRGKLTSISLAGHGSTASPGIRDNFRTKIIINGQSVGGSQTTAGSNSTLFSGMEAGPVPDTTAFIQKLEEEKRRQEKGEVPDNRSFLAKYWMYIVPLVIFMAINGAAAPEGQS